MIVVHVGHARREMEVALPKIDADDGCGTQLRYLLHRHGLCGEFRVTASDPLPATLLSALRLHAMTPAELYLRDAPPEHANPPPAVEFVGAQNERYALLSARRLLRDHTPSAHAVAVLLERLCCVAPEAPLRRHARDGAMQAALGALLLGRLPHRWAAAELNDKEQAEHVRQR